MTRSAGASMAKSETQFAAGGIVLPTAPLGRGAARDPGSPRRPHHSGSGSGARAAQAFPDRSLAKLAACRGFPLFAAGNLNGAEAIKYLQSVDADLGIVLGTRILKRGTFPIPKQGSINLHKGKVPEYRGMPPGFRELYDGASSAGVTIHFVDDGPDTGDVPGAAEIPIHTKETPESLRRKYSAHRSQFRSFAPCPDDGAGGDFAAPPEKPAAFAARLNPACTSGKIAAGDRFACHPPPTPNRSALRSASAMMVPSTGHFMLNWPLPGR